MDGNNGATPPPPPPPTEYDLDDMDEVVDDFLANYLTLVGDDEDANDEEQVMMIENPQATHYMECSLYVTEPPATAAVINMNHLASSRGAGPSEHVNGRYVDGANGLGMVLDDDVVIAANQASTRALGIYNQHQNEFASLEMEQLGSSHGAGPSHGLVGASHGTFGLADGSANMLGAGPMTVFGGGVIQQGMMIPATVAGASSSGMKRKTPVTEAQLRRQIFKKQKDASVELNVSVSDLTKAAKDLGWSRWPGESGKRILFIHVTRTSDGSTDGLNIPKLADLLHLKNELKDSFIQLVPSTYNIIYQGEAIETNLAWRNCVQAFGETGNGCMKLSIHE